CEISAVVVDLPLVPVMAMNGASGAWALRSRTNSSMSPMTSTPAARASSTLQCGLGWVSGTPGDSTKAAGRDQSMPRRSTVTMPSACAFSTLCGLSSHASTSASPATSACAVASPEPPSPKSATCLPAKELAAIIWRLPQLEGREPDQGEDDGDDPEADHHLALGPAELFEMVMDQRHQEDALDSHLEIANLNDDRQDLDHEQAADDGQHDLVLGGDRDGADQATHGERAGVAHEDGRRRRVEPQEA